MRFHGVPPSLRRDQIYTLLESFGGSIKEFTLIEGPHDFHARTGTVVFAEPVMEAYVRRFSPLLGQLYVEYEPVFSSAASHAEEGASAPAPRGDTESPIGPQAYPPALRRRVEANMVAVAKPPRGNLSHFDFAIKAASFPLDLTGESEADCCEVVA